jgi:hypothetical protein
MVAAQLGYGADSLVFVNGKGSATRRASVAGACSGDVMAHDPDCDIVLAYLRSAAEAEVRFLDATVTAELAWLWEASVLAAWYTGGVGRLRHQSERCPRCLFAVQVFVPVHCVSLEAASAKAWKSSVHS